MIPLLANSNLVSLSLSEKMNYAEVCVYGRYLIEDALEYEREDAAPAGLVLHLLGGHKALLTQRQLPLSTFKGTVL